MESDPASNVFALPARICGQTLHGYVRSHLRQIEQALSFGVPYSAITEAVHAAGFASTSVHTIHQAVYRARRHKPRFGINLRAASPASQPPAGLPQRWSSTPPSSTKEKPAKFGDRFRKLARPPDPGEDNPLV
jgi:hypothetical protein